MGVAGVARQRPQSKPQSLVSKDVDTDVYVEKVCTLGNCTTVLWEVNVFVK